MYLEPDTIIGNFEAGITKFIVTRLPLYNLNIALIKGFCGTASENQLFLLLPLIHFCVIQLKMPYTTTYIEFSAVHCSACLHGFPGLALVSLCSYHEMRAEIFPPA
jgi:hypothetical protein